MMTQDEYKLTKAEKLLEEIAGLLNDNMGWIMHAGQGFAHQDKDLFGLSSEIKIVYNKIQKYLKEE